MPDLTELFLYATVQAIALTFETNSLQVFTYFNIINRNFLQFANMKLQFGKVWKRKSYGQKKPTAKILT